MAKFRFQDLKIWQFAIEIADELFDIADDLEERKLYRFAGQIRGAGMSMSNNIAEGSGSESKREFGRFLNIARRSTFKTRILSCFWKNEGFYLKSELTSFWTTLNFFVDKSVVLRTHSDESVNPVAWF